MSYMVDKINANRKTGCLLFALVVLSASALANGAETAADCTMYADEKERVRCYDTFFMPDAQTDAPATFVSTETISSPVAARRAQEEALSDQWFSITPHRPNYILPATYNASANYEQYGPAEELFSDSEVKFQLSLKTTLLSDFWRDSTVFAAYTQQSYWQLYADDEVSAPFRETNHEPELVWQVPLDFEVLGFRAQVASLAFNHQSNGRSRPLSRSWNRVTGEIVFDRGPFVVSAKTWARVDDPDPDDNPDIEDYMGRMFLGAAYKGGRHTLALGLKNSLGSDMRSGVEFNWTFPLTERLKGFLQIYSGYGENMIDMEEYNNRIGLGVALTDWL